MSYAICFDFPEAPGEPIYAGWAGDQLGFAPTLTTAATWGDEETAQRYLDNYGPSIRECGVVVEVSA
jgi:hypothetical protein